MVILLYKHLWPSTQISRPPSCACPLPPVRICFQELVPVGLLLRTAFRLLETLCPRLTLRGWKVPGTLIPLRWPLTRGWCLWELPGPEMGHVALWRALQDQAGAPLGACPSPPACFPCSLQVSLHRPCTTKPHLRVCVRESQPKMPTFSIFSFSLCSP